MEGGGKRTEEEAGRAWLLAPRLFACSGNQAIDDLCQTGAVFGEAVEVVFALAAGRDDATVTQ